MIKVIGVIGIISVFIAIILYSIGNLQMNKGMVQHVINTTKDPYMHYVCRVNGKEIKGKVPVDISWFSFDDNGYISFFRFMWTLFKRSIYIGKHEQDLIQIEDEAVDKETINNKKWTYKG